MAVFKPLVLDKNEEDISKVMKSLYRFSEELKFTIANLSLEDNMDNSVLEAITTRNNKTREISFHSDEFVIDFENYSSGLHTRLEQTDSKISFLVDSGKVVETMLSRMELYGEYITLKTGQVVIEAQNMSLDKVGNVDFSGDIIGGSINIAGNFIVNVDGSCMIADSLTVGTLNPTNGIYASELEVYNDDNYVNNVTGTVTCMDAMATSVTCRKLYQTSDRRRKKSVRQLETAEADAVLQKIQPATYRLKGSGSQAMGCMADDLTGTGLPLVRDSQGHLAVAYNNLWPVYVAAIQRNQVRIDALKQKLREEWNVQL